MPPGVRFNPFPGLRPFEPDEDHLFFGREKEIDDLLRRLRSCRFLVSRRNFRKREIIARPLRPDPLPSQRLHGNGGF